MRASDNTVTHTHTQQARAHNRDKHNTDRRTRHTDTQRKTYEGLLRDLDGVGYADDELTERHGLLLRRLRRLGEVDPAARTQLRQNGVAGGGRISREECVLYLY